MRRAASVLAIVFALSLSAQQQPAAPDPVPESVESFQTAAARVLEETGVPGAGIALVQESHVEWAGGIGFADRDHRTPVTADTAFRVGSISKTFVALSLVQLSEDGLLDLDAPVREILPDIVIDNEWEDSEPVRVIHLLQHTAGFDDMHFNEMYVPRGEPERSLEEVLLINPRSRKARWTPGTRMSYSNPGYAVAGLVLEKIAEMGYEEYIANEIFKPLGMTRSTFHLAEAIGAGMAQGYGGAAGPPVGYRDIYLRPAGNMVSSARDLSRFVQMLLNWGELGDAFVVDPEYLGNMEQPRTTLASAAGLRSGYGSGIFTRLDLPYKLLGHDGGIDGFVASYAYSPSRDAGFVVLLNSTGARAGEAMRRISTLAINYLKRDVAAPKKPESSVAPDILDRYVGYYHDANPRNQIAWAVQSLFSGRQIVRDGSSLFARPIIGERVRLVAVNETMFRLENEVDASRVFIAAANGGTVMAGGQLYAERTARWPLDVLRGGVATALALIASVFLVAIVWVGRVKRAKPRGFWELKLALLLCPSAVLMPAAGLAMTPMTAWGMRNAGTVAVFVGTLAIPTLGLVVAVFSIGAIREHASRLLVTYAALVALAMGGLSLYLSTHELLGLRMWSY